MWGRVRGRLVRQADHLDLNTQSTHSNTHGISPCGGGAVYFFQGDHHVRGYAIEPVAVVYTAQPCQRAKATAVVYVDIDRAHPPGSDINADHHRMELRARESRQYRGLEGRTHYHVGTCGPLGARSEVGLRPSSL